MITRSKVQRYAHRLRHNNHKRVVLPVNLCYEVFASHVGIDYPVGGSPRQVLFDLNHQVNGQANFSYIRAQPFSKDSLCSVVNPNLK